MRKSGISMELVVDGQKVRVLVDGHWAELVRDTADAIFNRLTQDEAATWALSDWEDYTPD